MCDDTAIKTELDGIVKGISAQRSSRQQKEREKKTAPTSRVGPVLDLHRFGEVRLLFHFDFCHRLRSVHFQRVSVPLRLLAQLLAMLSCV